MQRPRSRLEQARLIDPAATDAQHVRTIAARLVDDLGLSEPPVDVYMVASLLGIRQVTVDPALPVSGCLLCYQGQFEILVRACDPPGRQRFTICHECSHTFFPGYEVTTQYRCSPADLPRGRRDVETLCDIASSELLLPTRLFGPDVQTATFGFSDLETLADRYEASLEATGHRLVAAWPEPAALLVLGERQKPSEVGTCAPPRLRLEYAHVEGEWPYFLRHKSVDPRDVFDRALQGEVVSETATISGICAQPVRAEFHAQLCPVTIEGEPHNRVLALARQARRRT